MTSRIASMATVAGLLPLSTACFGGHSMEPDADAGADGSAAVFDGGTGHLPQCEPAGAAMELLPGRAGPPPSLDGPRVVLLRARPSPEGGVVALIRSPWVTDDGVGGIRRLIALSPSGEVRLDVEITRDEVSFWSTADFVPAPAGWRVVGRDSLFPEGLTLWLAEVDSETGEMNRTVLETGWGAEELVNGPTAVTSERGDADVYVLREGELYRLTVEGGAITEERPLGPSFAANSRPFAVRSGDGEVTCLSVRERESGRVRMLELRGGEVTGDQVLLEGNAPFNPIPRASADGCAAAYFEPDERHPTLGRIRVTGHDGEALGWRGTAPGALALWPDGSVTLTAYDPDWPDRVNLWWIDAPAERCTVPQPLVHFPQQPINTALGALYPVTTPEGRFAVLAGLTAPGETAVARLRTAR